jgi:hypothetical protein
MRDIRWLPQEGTRSHRRGQLKSSQGNEGSRNFNLDHLRGFIDTAKEPKICNTMAVLQRGYIYEKRTRYVKTDFIESHLYSEIQVLYSMYR